MAHPSPVVELDGQYRALREEAGYLARERAMLLVKGPDAAEYLQGQLTNDVEALGPNEGCYAALLDRKGHLQADMRVLRLDPSGEIWIDLEPAPGPAVLKHLTMYSIGRDVEVEDVTERWAITSLIGPRAAGAGGFRGTRARACPALPRLGRHRGPRGRHGPGDRPDHQVRAGQRRCASGSPPPEPSR